MMQRTLGATLGEKAITVIGIVIFLAFGILLGSGLLLALIVLALKHCYS